MSGAEGNERPAGQPETGFLNPYNFVSIPDRETLPEELRDGPPAGHDRYDRELWTGTIPITLSTLTPLLLPDHAQAAAGSDDAGSPPPLPVRVDRDGRPMLSLSAMKGMLRSCYEAITNSRFGVFTGHDGQLAMRSSATREETARLKPAVVVARDQQEGTARIRWVRSLKPRHDVSEPKPTAAGSIAPQPAVWVPVGQAKRYRDGEALRCFKWVT